MPYGRFCQTAHPLAHRLKKSAAFCGRAVRFPPQEEEGGKAPALREEEFPAVADVDSILAYCVAQYKRAAQRPARK
jgi:hypothetical protein